MELWQQEEMAMNTATYKAIESKNIAAASNMEWWQQELLESTKDYQGYGTQYYENGTNALTATPPSPDSSSTSNVVTNVPIKIATPQYVNFDTSVIDRQEGLETFFFEQISGAELLISNNRNFINTINISYQPIINVSDFKNAYDPKKIVALQDTADVYFSNFIINLLTRIPDVPTSSSTNGTNVYITTSGNIVIETKDNASDERVEIQILSGGTIYSDTLGVSLS